MGYPFGRMVRITYLIKGGRFMKKALALVTALALALTLSGAALAAEAPFHIGVCTGTVSQSEDDLRGAEKLIELSTMTSSVKNI